jgi:hypothetical protein
MPMKRFLFKFECKDGDMELLPVPGLNPADPNYEAQLIAAYTALFTAIQSGDNDAIQTAALAIGDDVIIDYYYMIGTNKYNLLTAGGNPLVKMKYWQNYLVRDDGVRFPNWQRDFRLSRRHRLAYFSTFRTRSTLPIPIRVTGTVAAGWLKPALGRDVSVTVTLIQNGKVVSDTRTVAIPAGPVNVYNAEPIGTSTWVSSHLTIQEAIDAASTQPGYFVTVDAGTYTGHVNVTKNLTLYGAQVGVDARTRAGAETLIEGTFAIASGLTDMYY